MLLREIDERGCQGGVSLLRAWLARFKSARPSDGPVVRLEAEYGKQKQIVCVRQMAAIAFVAALQPNDP